MHYCKSLTHTDLRKLHNEELFYVLHLAIYCCVWRNEDEMEEASSRHGMEEKYLEGLIGKAEG
jgi:hypothetical protein